MESPTALYIIDRPEGNKADHDPLELRSTALLGIEGLLHPNTEDSLVIYTDDSVDPDSSKAGCGLAVYQGRRLLGTQNFRIPNGSSTLQAELYGIYKALVTVEPFKALNILLVTDSLGSIQVLQQRESTDNHLLLSSINELLKARSDADRESCFMLAFLSM